jgi:hypothetical protein
MPLYISITGTSRSVGVRVPASGEIVAPDNVEAALVEDGGLDDTTEYFYAVTALGTDGETVVSDEVSEETLDPDLSIEVSWDAVVNATGYRVYKGVATGDYDEYFAVDSTETSYLDDGTAGTAGTPPAEATAVVDGPLSVKAGTYAIVDVDDVEVRKSLNHHRSIGQYTVVATSDEYRNASGTLSTLPSNS